MNRKDYIELLANSPLPKSAIDKTTQEPDRPEFVSNYETAVLNGFKWNIAYFEKKYKINDLLYSEVWNIREDIKTLKNDQQTTTASHFWEVKQDIENIQENIQEINQEIEDNKELTNKRINDTNEKIEKSKIALKEEIDIIQTNQDKTISNIEKEISDIKYDQTKSEQAIKDKSDKVHKHNTTDIIWLDKEIKKIKQDIEDKPSIEEIKDWLSNFYTKKETYSKKEVDNKIESIPSKWSTTIFTWGKSSINDDVVSSTNTRSSEKINERSLPSWWETNWVLRKIDSTDYNAEWVRDVGFGIALERWFIWWTLSDQLDLQGKLITWTSIYDESTNRLGINNTSPSSPLDVKSESNWATVWSELITATNDRLFSWTPPNRSWTWRSRVSNRRSHTAGANATTLANTWLSSAPVAWWVYQITYNLTTTTVWALTMSFWGTAQLISQWSTIVTAVTFVELIVATDASPLNFTPDATRVWSIDSISIKKITPRATPLVNLRNTAWDIAMQIKTTGDIAWWGAGVIGIWDNCLPYLSSSVSMIAIGSKAFNSAVTASGIAIWQNALKSNVSGSGNAAIGTNTLPNLISGGSNAAICNQSLYQLLQGANNCAVGVSALYAMLTGSYNTAIWPAALFTLLSWNNNTAIWPNALGQMSSWSTNLWIGYNAGATFESWSNNIIIGNNIDFPWTTWDNQLNIWNVIFGTWINWTWTTIAGAVWIGTNAPTAQLHIGAGTDSQAPLKLTSWTNLTTPQDWSFEFDWTNLYFTVWGVRKTVTLT